MQALCDREAFTEYKDLPLGKQLVDVITHLLVDIMCSWLFIEGIIIFIQKICVLQMRVLHEDRRGDC